MKNQALSTIMLVFGIIILLLAVIYAGFLTLDSVSAMNSFKDFVKKMF